MTTPTTAPNITHYTVGGFKADGRTVCGGTHRTLADAIKVRDAYMSTGSLASMTIYGWTDDDECEEVA